MFAEHMKRGTPWDENPFGNSGFRHSSGSYGGSASSSGGSSGSCSSEAAPQHFIPIQILPENFQFDPDMDMDFEPKSINKIEIPDVFRQADQAARKQHEHLQREHRPKSSPLIPTATPLATDNTNTTVPQQNPSFEQQSHSPNYNSNHIRHIPIIVEGGKHKAPSPTPAQPQQNNNQQSSHLAPQSQPQPHLSPLQKRQQKLQQKAQSSSNQSPVKPVPIPMPPPPSYATPDDKPPSPPPRSPKNKNPSNYGFAQQQEQQQQAPTQQQPTQTQQQQPPQQPTVEVKSQPIPAPAPQQIDESQVPPPIKKPTPQPPSTPLEKVEEISKDVKDLEKQINEFTATTKTKQYLYLDEMLTRKLITLDDIDCCGLADVRQARKDCIKLVQSFITKLETKVADNAKANNTNDAAAIHRSEASLEVNQAEKKDGANCGNKPAAGAEDKTKGSSDNKK